MPNRILKESICTSANLNSLSAEAERLFYRIIVNCDDFGRLDARSQILRAKCFPLRIDSISDKNIINWLNELQQQQLITVYESGGQNFLYLDTWESHQQIRAKKSKYPDPSSCTSKRDDLQADDSKCNQVPAIVPVIQSNPIQSNPNTIRKESDVKTSPSSDNGHGIDSVFSLLDKARGYRPPRREAEAASIKRMLKSYTPDQIIKTYQEMKQDSFYQDKELFMMTVETQIGAKVHGSVKRNPQSVLKPHEYTKPESL